MINVLISLTVFISVALQSHSASSANFSKLNRYRLRGGLRWFCGSFGEWQYFYLYYILSCI